MKRKCIICDLDNTLLDSEHILQEAEALDLYGDLKWDYFYNHCNDVEVIPEILKLLNVFFINGITIIFSTARNKKCYDTTVEKLCKEGIYFDKLLMRKDGDLRDACEVKKDHLIEIMKEYDIIAFIDDDLTNCNMAKELGILSLRVV